jgi:hypothetical protein
MSYHNGSIWPHDNACWRRAWRGMAQARRDQHLRKPDACHVVPGSPAHSRSFTAASPADPAAARRSTPRPARRKPGRRGAVLADPVDAGPRVPAGEAEIRLNNPVVPAARPAPSRCAM